MAIPRLPDGDHQFMWMYRELTGAEPPSVIEAKSISTVEGLGFTRLGRAGAHLPGNHLQLIIQDVFVHAASGTWGVLSRSYDKTYDVLVFYNLLEDGTVVTTELTPRSYLWNHGIGLFVGRDTHYVAHYLYASDFPGLWQLHQRKLAEVASKRGTRVRTDCSMELWLAMRTARSRARGGWTARELKVASWTALALGALGVATPIAVAVLYASRLSQLQPRGLGLALFLAIAVASIAVMRRSRKLGFHWLGPLITVLLTRGRQEKSTDVAAVVAERQRARERG